MAVRPVITELALDRAEANLSAAIKTYGVPPCWGDPKWTEIDPSRSLDAIRGCNTCPVFPECEDRAALVATHDKAHSVLAGIQYDAAGEPVDVVPEMARQERDRRLIELAELGSVA